MTKGYTHVLLVTGIIIALVFSSNNLLNQRTYAHIFTTDETASFLAFADQLQVESELVQTNLINKNLSLAQNHANKAAALLTPGIIVEIAEANQKVADDLSTAVNNLQKVTSTSENQLQMVKQLVTDINTTLGEATNIRISQGQGQGEISSNFLERGIEFLTSIFGGGSSEEADVNQEDRDKTTQPLAFADLVDSVLVNYGNAYAVDFDMTNMSNMVMMEGGDSSSMSMNNTANDDSNRSNNSMNMDSMNMSSSMTMNMNMNDDNNRSYSLVDVTDYQSAQALAAKSQEMFNTELKPMAQNDSSAFIAKLENGLTELNDSIQSKDSPMDIMMIVHTQIHPNLLQAFNLKLR
ncbi:MAG TPA: hypothetical protein VE573_11735 [Nitrososphaeraceae archaeon]|jgi:hypothetical protein|nr:hypothetical protein [Nitrososphaeraceae archaeon]